MQQRVRPSVYRCLFGRPDAGESLKDADKLLQLLHDNKADEWDFDFRVGRPTPDTDGKVRRYEWTPVDSSESIPSFYNRVLQRSSHPAGRVSVSAANDAVTSEIETSSSNISAGHPLSERTATTAPSAALHSESSEPTSGKGPDNGLNAQ